MDSPSSILGNVEALQLEVLKDFEREGREPPKSIASLFSQLSQVHVILPKINGKSRPCSENEPEDEKEIFQVPNAHVQKQYSDGQSDFLYHLGTVVSIENTAKIYKDVRYICVGGTPSRMLEFAVNCLDILKVPVAPGLGVTDLCGGHARYVMYKAGPVLTVSHGMGNPSLSIMLHEIFKLLHYARASKSVKLVRIGTCGGVGVDPGTTVISEQIYNGLFQNHYEQHILGKPVRRMAVLDKQLVQDLIYHAGKPSMNIPVVAGNTLCANDFYEEQARLDGAFCEFSHDERIDFLQKCSHAYGIRNIEMESLVFSALTHHAGLAAAVVCVALVNRLVDDKVSLEAEKSMEEWQRRPQRLVAEMIRCAEDARRESFEQLRALRETLKQTSQGTQASDSNQAGSDSALEISPESSRAESPSRKIELENKVVLGGGQEAQLNVSPDVVLK